MAKSVVFPLNVFVHTNKWRFIEKLREMGVNNFSLFWKFSSLLNLMDRYYTGTCETDEFLDEIQLLFPVIQDKQKLADAWNSIRTLTDDTYTIIEEIHSLAKQYEVNFVFVGSTTLLHYEKMSLIKALPGEHFYSHIVGKQGERLISHAINDLSEGSVIFFKPVGSGPVPFLGRLGWFIAPFQKWFHSEAQSYIDHLHKMGRQDGFELVPSHPEEGGANIRAKLERLKMLAPLRPSFPLTTSYLNYNYTKDLPEYTEPVQPRRNSNPRTGFY